METMHVPKQFLNNKQKRDSKCDCFSVQAGQEVKRIEHRARDMYTQARTMETMHVSIRFLNTTSREAIASETVFAVEAGQEVMRIENRRGYVRARNNKQRGDSK